MCTLVVESGEPPFEEPFEAPEPPWPEDHAPQDLEWPPDGARQQNSADPRDDQEEDCRRVESGKPCSRESKTCQEPKTVFFVEMVREGDVPNCSGKSHDPGKPAFRRLGILPEQLL